jgi:hypothetical protein
MSPVHPKVNPNARPQKHTRGQTVAAIQQLLTGLTANKYHVAVNSMPDGLYQIVITPTTPLQADKTSLATILDPISGPE